MAAAPANPRTGSPRAQLPPCYYEGYLEKRGAKEKVSGCYYYVEKLDLSGFVSLIDDPSRDRNLEAARLNLRMKDGEIKLTAPNLEARELWKGFLYSVVDLAVPTTLTLLPGQLHMLKEVVEKEKMRRQARVSSRAPSSPLSLPLVGEIPACFRPVSRTEAEVLLERHPDCGNMLLRPGRDGSSLAVTTRQDLNGAHESGHQLIPVEHKIYKAYFCQDYYRQRLLTISIQFGLAVWFCSGQELPAHPCSLAWMRAGRAAITPPRVNGTEPT
uniref:Signal transducing adaptor family member 2a n=1 Tax=Sinocyclocheilus grahami TaxID=75366 RepID=A0A672L527_SINGR